MNKKNFVVFLTALMLLVGVGFTQNANAASNWNQTSQGWTYTENGTIKTGWLLDGGSWYYLNYSGIMKTGWINDNGTWYYLIENGTLDNTKTTTTMPTELVAAYNRIKQYVTKNIYYVETLTKDGKSSYKFNEDISDSPDEYYYTPSTDKVFLARQGILTRLDASEVVNGKYTFEQCKEIADAFFGNSHQSGYKYTVNSDAKANGWGEYYFTIYSTTTNQQVDNYYVNAMDGQIVRK